jgi:hypothetical protein
MRVSYTTVLWSRHVMMTFRAMREGIVAVALAVATLGATGCTTVRASQREHLAKRGMTDDRAGTESRYLEHERGAREGASGGAGQPGGGCGCN